MALNGITTANSEGFSEGTKRGAAEEGRQEMSDLREVASELLEALKIAAIWAPHNHGVGEEENGQCPKCRSQRAIAEAEKLRRQPTHP